MKQPCQEDFSHGSELLDAKDAAVLCDAGIVFWHASRLWLVWTESLWSDMGIESLMNLDWVTSEGAHCDLQSQS